MNLRQVILIIFFVAIAASLEFVSLQAQCMHFCKDVDEDGYPKNESTSFTIGSERSWLKILVKLDDAINCNEVKYVIYQVTRNGEEKYDNTITQEVEEDWVWFWKEITFYNDGKYNVYVYDEYDNFLVSSSVSINFNQHSSL